MRYHFIPRRMAIIRQTVVSIDRNMEELDSSYAVVVVKTGVVVVRAVWLLPQKVQGSQHGTQQFHSKYLHPGQLN